MSLTFVAATVAVVAVAILTGAIGCSRKPVERVDALSTATATKPAPAIEPVESPVAPDVATSQSPVPPTATPVLEVIYKVIIPYRSALGDLVSRHGSHCNLDDNFRATVRHWTTNSKIYLREYHDLRDLDEDDVRIVIVFLETQRGRYDRLCNIETGLALPNLYSVTDVKKLYDSRLKSGDGTSTCEVAAGLESLISNLDSNSIHYLRGAFNIDSLSLDDVIDLISHFEGRRAYYDRLCAAGR